VYHITGTFYYLYQSSSIETAVKSLSLGLEARVAEITQLKSIIGIGYHVGECNVEAGQNRSQWRIMVLMISGFTTVELLQNTHLVSQIILNLCGKEKHSKSTIYRR
jgi:hypothetical protein